MKALKISTIKGLSILLFIFYPLLGQSQIKAKEIDYLKISDIEYSKDSLFYLLQIRPVLPKLDTTRGTVHKIALSEKEKSKYLKLINKSDILNIKSNNNKSQNSVVPFRMNYNFAGQNHEILAYQTGMTISEKVSFEKYIEDVERIVDRNKVVREFLLGMPDGKYQLRSPQKYVITIGPSGWETWEKKNNEVYRIVMQLVFLNGKEIEARAIEKINPKKIKSLKVLKPHEADSLYGEKAKYGVVIITTK